MRLLGQFQTSLFKNFTSTKSAKRLQAIKNKKSSCKTSKGEKVTYFLICVFVLLPGCLCAFWCFWCFWCVQNLVLKKKKRIQNSPNNLIYITTNINEVRLQVHRHCNHRFAHKKVVEDSSRYKKSYLWCFRNPACDDSSLGVTEPEKIGFVCLLEFFLDPQITPIFL